MIEILLGAWLIGLPVGFVLGAVWAWRERVEDEG